MEKHSKSGKTQASPTASLMSSSCHGSHLTRRRLGCIGVSFVRSLILSRRWILSSSEWTTTPALATSFTRNGTRSQRDSSTMRSRSMVYIVLRGERRMGMKLYALCRDKLTSLKMCTLANEDQVRDTRLRDLSTLVSSLHISTMT